MPRVRPRREICDCLDCADDSSRQVDPTLRSALARLEPPPKSFIIIIDGALIANPSGGNSLELAQLPHLDSLAREGCNGLLAATVGEHTPPLSCQILQGSAANAPPMPQRFKNIHVALVGNCSSLEAIGEGLGSHSTRVLPLNAPQKWPQTERLAKELTSCLGVQPLEEYVASFSLNKPLEDNESDMIILWMQLPEITHRQEEEEEDEASSEAIDQACVALEWTDLLLRSLDSIPGFRDTVLTTLVVTPPPPTPSLKTDGNSNIPMPRLLQHPLAQEQIELDVRTLNSGEKVVLHRPLQSYQFCGMKQVKVDTERSAVVVHRLPGIVRKDRVEELNVAAIEAKGGGRCILGERMLFEIAYKIDKAPKYGA